MVRSQVTSAGRSSLAVLALTLASASATSAWTVTYLHPAGADSSYGTGASSETAVGHATYSGNPHAVLWVGNTGTLVDLHPPDALISQALAVYSGQQAGRVLLPGPYGGVWKAALWSGSAASFVNLTGPVGTGRANAIFETQQGGFSNDPVPHATMWSSSAASMVDFTPVGGTPSAISGINGISALQQVGYSNQHAVVWNNSPEYWVDLHPANLGSNSEAFGVDDGQQVGMVSQPDNSGYHAGLWYGYAGSWKDLQPVWGFTGVAYAVSHGVQAGMVVSYDQRFHAVIWKGTPQSCEDLQAYLASDFSYSFARAVWTDGRKIRVVGDGWNASTNRQEALLWVYDTGACPADFNGDGQVDDGDFVLFASAYTLGSCAEPGMPPGCPADFNDDSFVDDADFVIFGVAYDNLYCP